MDLLRKLALVFLYYDVNLVYWAKCAVEFVEEWTSVTQKWIERLLMVLTAAAGMETSAAAYSHHHSSYSWVLVSLNPICGFNQWVDHGFSPTIRALRLLCGRGVASRVLWQIWMLMIVFRPPHELPTDFYLICWYAMACLFEYVAAFGSEGQPGRRRRLALSKLKELFGTSWIPQPHGAQ